MKNHFCLNKAMLQLEPVMVNQLVKKLELEQCGINEVRARGVLLKSTQLANVHGDSVELLTRLPPSFLQGMTVKQSVEIPTQQERSNSALVLTKHKLKTITNR